MKHLILSFLLAGSVAVHAQNNTNYNQLVNAIPEIELADSLFFDSCPAGAVVLDSLQVRTLFRQLYHTTGKSWGTTISWWLAGKITRYSNYDLLLLVEKNEGKDGICFNTVHLVSISKEGEYIAALGLYINRNNNTTRYTASSFLFKDLSIIQNTRIYASSKNFGGRNEYKINEEGRFVYYAKN
jgi:hypothetical protein